MICIHTTGRIYKKYNSECNGDSDAAQCPEWRMIRALDQLTLSIRGLISLQPGGKLILQGMN